jgi:TIR domain
LGYLPPFEEDVFISYAHLDDDTLPRERRGWVAQLDYDLKQLVAAKLREDPAVWRDPDIRSNEDFEQVISDSLARAATLLCVMSPTFVDGKWCQRELEKFVSSAERHLGVQIGAKNRIFKVEKLPVDPRKVEFLRPLQGTGTYKFYGPDPEGKLRPFRPQLDDRESLSYYRRVDDLAEDIATTLKRMREGASEPTAGPAQQLAIYVAAATSDLDEEASEIRRDLRDRGYIVLPPGDLPFRAREFKERVSQYLEQATLSIHLIGKEYGFVPEGENSRSNAWIEIDLATEQARKSGLPRFIWMRQGLTAIDSRQSKFLEYLQSDPTGQNGAEVLESKLEELKTVVQDKLKAIKNGQQAPQLAVPHQLPTPQGEQQVSPSALPPTPGEDLIRIYIICDQVDLTSDRLAVLADFLYEQGYECILPSRIDDEAEALQEHADNLEICDACIIFFGEGSEKWFATKLRELRKTLTRRNHPILAKGIYMAPPDAVLKKTFRTHEAVLLGGSETFSGDCVQPFLNQLQGKARGASN